MKEISISKADEKALKSDISIACADYQLMLDFSEPDAENLITVYPHIKPALPRVVNWVVEKIAENQIFSVVLENNGLKKKDAIKVLSPWLHNLFKTDYLDNSQLVEQIYRTAIAHERVGIDPACLTIPMNFFLRALQFVLLSRARNVDIHIISICMSLIKITSLHLALMTYTSQRVKEIMINRAINHVIGRVDHARPSSDVFGSPDLH